MKASTNKTAQIILICVIALLVAAGGVAIFFIFHPQNAAKGISSVTDSQSSTTEPQSSSTAVSSQKTSGNSSEGSSGTPSSSSKNTSSAKQVSYNSYTNPRYGFSIDYPDNFKKGSEPVNGDGLIFESADGSAKLTASGMNNALEDTAASVLKSLQKEHTGISYKVQNGNFCIASWTEGNKIFYEKDVVGTGSINTFLIEYPESQKDQYAPIVSHIESSFKTPGIKIGH